MLFRPRTNSAGLLEDKKRCRMDSDERRIMCDSRVGDDMTYFLVGCGKLERDPPMRLEDGQNCGGQSVVG